MLFAQQDLPISQPLGVPLMRHFLPADYNNMHRQNWSIIQDKRGVIYVGNTAGLLTYDGVKWRKYETEAKSLIRSFAMDEDGRVYYGAKDDFGYLDNDALGQLQFVSLRHWLPEDIKDLKDVWEIYSLNGKIYFLKT
ncbi:hypothetical protein KO493_10480 [Tamlana agarivorans]|uniref:Uncharacterized protein n=1 Tax=Pseudotamlana agarivorans TaxID=481183 RepID=A0ACC5UA18_9FLAO|nr:hypothetical protein [Tamlana agarivorans]MBU2951121.1 hypothetical protein [Tamlana agarivorans]